MALSEYIDLQKKHGTKHLSRDARLNICRVESRPKKKNNSCETFLKLKIWHIKCVYYDEVQALSYICVSARLMQWWQELLKLDNILLIMPRIKIDL